MAGFTDFIKTLLTNPEGPRQALASLRPVETQERTDMFGLGGDGFVFPFFPESVSDSVAINYTDIEVLGLSHQLVQWVGNGGRTITFDAMLSRDIRVNQELPKENRSVDPLAPENVEMNQDVRYSVAMLRSYCYPTKANPAGTGVTFSLAPPVLALTLDGMALGRGGDDTIFVVMSTCDVQYTRLFASGVPRKAKVSLEFKEVVQAGGSVEPWWASDFETAMTRFSPPGERAAREDRVASIRARNRSTT